MKEIVIGTLIAAMFVALGSMWASYAVRNNNGIVAVDGYAHGVALCGEEPTWLAESMDATAWYDGIATYTINKGHEKDPQVEELVKLATIHCRQF